MRTIYTILIAIGLVHLLNDTMQSVIPAIFPILKESLNLTYTQIGFILFSLNMTASVMQPVVGLVTDKRPAPFLLPVGMASSLVGMLGIGLAPNYPVVIMSVILVGIGSAVFHPEGSRVAHMAAGKRKGLAQSIFQVGGNSGQALAPIMTALIFVPLGQVGAVWFTAIAAIAIVIALYISKWYKEALARSAAAAKPPSTAPTSRQRLTILGVFICIIFFVFARSWFHSGITALYPFFVMDEWGINLEQAQIYLFLFLAFGAFGTFAGGPISDWIGKRNVLLFSMLGSAPLALLLPYADRFWAYPLIAVLGFIILSSFSVIVVYAQELVPGKIGTVSGLIIGLAFGMGAIGGAALGVLADHIGITGTIELTSFLPLFGFMAFLLPSDAKLKQWTEG